jgi:cystathionine beta-lyase
MIGHEPSPERMTHNPLTAVSPQGLRGRRSYKWRCHPDDVLPMFIAEMDTPLAPAVERALTEAVRRGDTGYAHPLGLAEAFAGFAARHYDWTPDPRMSIVVPDVLQGIGAVLALVSSPGAGVVINTPVYPPFFAVIPAAGRRVVQSPLRREADGTYGFDLDALDRDLAVDGVEVLLLCNPHNPTGLVLRPDELLAIAQLAQRHGVRVLADEIHAPLVYPGARHSAFATLAADAAQESIVFVSASKAFNLPGLKAALIVAGGDPAWQVLRDLPVEVTFGTGLFGVIGGEAAFSEGDEWLSALIMALDSSRRTLAHLIESELRQVRYTPPQATFLAWLDLRPLGLGDDPAGPLLERGRLALTSGPAFGAPGVGHARLTFATSPELLNDAVRRIRVAAALP